MKRKPIEYILSFSGGKDSTALLIYVVENKLPLNRVIWCNTGKEFPQVLAHIKKVQEICPVPIEEVKMDFNYWFSEHIRITGKNKGVKGFSWPDFNVRWCTGIKNASIRATICRNTIEPGKWPSEKGYQNKQKRIIQYVGIAYNERKRAAKQEPGKEKIIYPLIEAHMTEKANLKFCYDHGFDWGGLYRKFKRASCWCCPLSSVAELRNLYNYYPELWIKLQEMDLKSARTFKPGLPLSELTEKFKKENERKSLFTIKQNLSDILR